MVGLSAGTASWMTGLIFLHHEAVETLLRRPGATSFVLATTDRAGADRLAGTLPDLSVSTREALSEGTRGYIADVFAAPVQMMVLIAVAIGGLLVGLTIYSASVERVKEYGVLKSVGMRNEKLSRLPNAVRPSVPKTARGSGREAGG